MGVIIKTCCHQWTIEPADGNPTSSGICQHCGEIREFKNSTPDTGSWFGAEKSDKEKREQTEVSEARRAHDRNERALPWNAGA